MASPPPAATHVAVAAFPFGTHAGPLFTVVRRLAAASPGTTFSFFNTSQSNKTIFNKDTTTQFPNIKAYDVWDGVPEGYAFTGKPQERIELFMTAALESLRFNIETAVAETGRKVSCLLTDAFFWFGGEIAQDMGVPSWIQFWTAGPCSLSAHFYTDLIRQQNATEPKGRPLSFIPGMAKILVQDLPEGVLFGNLESVFSHMLHQMGQMLPRATAVFINSFEELDTNITNDLKSKFKKFLNVGPLNLASPPPLTPDESGCLQWLEKQKVAASVAYISFGSVMVPPQEELEAIAAALEGSGVPFIWSLRDNVRQNLPNGFLEKTRKNGMVVPWAPQNAVLAHNAVGVFVTHCGWNSVMESIVGGVPMICRPFFGDQRLNGRMVQDVWEIGVRVDGGAFTKEGLENCLDLVLRQERGKRMRDKINSLKELANEAVGPRGSSSDNFKLLLDVVTGPGGVQE
ncbi:hypothetical protein TIFTF001_013387 [Ficus carica]|uniref:Glycosyltransferase n=1 Tax=Ficus carica TaxID=3494 RepID=A0AA88A1W9_FICCA|nr:hypothetical protein TIFTF001_013387 [Ficus carica]